MTLEEAISKEIWDQIRCIEDRIIEVDTEEIIEIKTMKEVEGDLGKDAVSRKYSERNERSNSSRSG